MQNNKKSGQAFAAKQKNTIKQEMPGRDGRKQEFSKAFFSSETAIPKSSKSTIMTS